MFKIASALNPPLAPPNKNTRPISPPKHKILEPPLFLGQVFYIIPMLRLCQQGYICIFANKTILIVLRRQLQIVVIIIIIISPFLTCLNGPSSGGLYTGQVLVMCPPVIVMLAILGPSPWSSLFCHLNTLLEASSALDAWLFSSHLWLNPDKKQFIWLGGRLQRDKIDTTSLHLGSPHPVFLLSP